jgi:hypothetical protein
MKTRDLIRAMAGDVAAPQPTIGKRVGAALIGGGAIAAVWFAVDLGIRPDFLGAMQGWRFPLKLAVMLVAFGCSLWASLRLARPDTTLRESMALLALAPALLAAALLVELAQLPSPEWAANAVGRNWRICLVSIPLLSIAPLAALLIALRAGAPRSPSLAGAVAGGTAAALAATLYAMHCPDDSPLFVALWYALAMLPALISGALAGRAVLRW